MVHRPVIAAEAETALEGGGRAPRGTRRRPGMWYAAVPICNLAGRGGGSSALGTGQIAEAPHGLRAPSVILSLLRRLACTLLHTLKLLEFKTLGPLANLRDWVCALSRHLPSQVGSASVARQLHITSTASRPLGDSLRHQIRILSEGLARRRRQPSHVWHAIVRERTSCPADRVPSVLGMESSSECIQ